MADRDPETGVFLKGKKGGPGRPKGSRNILGEEFLKAMQEDFHENGTVAIETVREERPHEYLKVIASLLPKDVNLEVTASEAFQRVIDALNEKAMDGLAERASRQRQRSPNLRH